MVWFVVYEMLKTYTDVSFHSRSGSGTTYRCLKCKNKWNPIHAADLSSTYGRNK